MRNYRDLLSLRPWQRHSLVLTVAGVVYALVGISYLLTTPAPSREVSLYLALSLMPMNAWALVWIAVGLLAVASSRWPAWSESWGYVALTALASMWSAFYLMGALLSGRGSSLSGACVWGLVAFIWWAVSGLRNPLPPPRMLAEEHARRASTETRIETEGGRG